MQRTDCHPGETSSGSRKLRPEPSQMGTIRPDKASTTRGSAGRIQWQISGTTAVSAPWLTWRLPANAQLTCVISSSKEGRKTGAETRANPAKTPDTTTARSLIRNKIFCI